jgi:hypothetical protein
MDTGEYKLLTLCDGDQAQPGQDAEHRGRDEYGIFGQRSENLACH